jgi:ABC-2 type transport system permease protein
MVLASLFLAWGREAFHLTQLAIEPIYFVSGLNFPVGRLGLVGSLAISILPLAVGLDAMRQLAFVDAPGLGGTPPPAIEAAILVVMTVVFIGAARWMLAALELRARRDGRLTARWQ